MDLNLLTALDALLAENSVVSAAERLHLTPPAVSRTLARLRDVTGDEILVRSGRRMVPTPHALAIRAEVQVLLQQARALLRPKGGVDVASLVRAFTLRAHDALVSAIGPRLIVASAHTAPGVQLRFLGENQGDSPDLARGNVDLELGATLPAVPEISHAVLAEDRMVLASRADHPLQQGKLTIERLSKAVHVAVSRRGRPRGPVDELMAARGLQRRVVATTSTAAAALELVASAEIVAIVPGGACHTLGSALGLRTRPLPLALPASPVVMSWHRRFDSDPAHAWLRQQVSDAAKSVDWARPWSRRGAAS